MARARCIYQNPIGSDYTIGKVYDGALDRRGDFEAVDDNGRDNVMLMAGWSKGILAEFELLDDDLCSE